MIRLAQFEIIARPARRRATAGERRLSGTPKMLMLALPISAVVIIPMGVLRMRLPVLRRVGARGHPSRLCPSDMPVP
jgi:hypothetical protein